ncbi:MAG TPA: diaminopimelate epimerase [Tepidisphaeraceae bacterium]|jgi:diaminopimelate epimerase|nr:diaminopimelate epimerase [Tepidisphaeraceae bacterium]
MRFTKMHGIGNDYVYVNGFDQQVPDPASVAAKVADRHFGIGADGLIMVLPSDKADVRMRMFNADGSESEMCGNGVRCVAKYAYDHGLTKNNPLTVETGRGVLPITLQTANGKATAATVNMGEPILDLAQIPVLVDRVGKQRGPNTHQVGVSQNNAGDPAMHRGRGRAQRPWLMDMTFVSMGNPHAVIYTDDVKGIDVERFGPWIEHDVAFPRRMNVHWVQVVSRSEVIMRTWERGSGVTLACGTGACAVCVAGVLTGNTDRTLLAHLPGGDLQLEWRESDKHVYMTGPATEVFTGEWPG